MSRQKKQIEQLKTRAVIYARVSSKEQQEEGYSLDSQIGLLRGYCLAKGFTVVEEIIEAETAKAAGRSEFSRMCQLIKSGAANAIIVEKTDRLYRNMKDRVTIDDLSTDLHFVKESSILTPASKSSEKFIHDIKLVMAKNYVDNLSEEAKKGMLEKAQQGIYPSHAPLGYINTISAGRRIIEPDPRVSAQITLLFSLYATGDYSVRDIAAEAIKIGVTSARGKRVSSSVIHQMLSNPIYIGRFRWNGIEYPGIHAPLVEQKVWDRIQRILSGRGDKSQPVSKDYAYRGLIRCGRCGCLMSPFTAKGKYIYYGCSGFKGCSKKVISEDAITDAVAVHFEGLAIKDEYLLPLHERVLELFDSASADHGRTMEFLEARRVQLEKKLKDLYLDSAAGKMSEMIYDALRQEMDADLAEVKAELARSDIEKLKSWEDISTFIKLLSNLAFSFKNADMADKRIMFNAALSNCSILDKNVSLELRPGFKVVWETNASADQNGPLYGMAGYAERLANSLLQIELSSDKMLVV